MSHIPALKAEFFKALGHPLRIRALELLSTRELTVSELVEEIAVDQPHLSQQLAVLRRAGFVVGRREGTNVVYSLADERIVALLAVSREILLERATAQRDELQRL